MFKKIKFKKLLMFAPLMTLMFCFNSPQNADHYGKRSQYTFISSLQSETYQ
jgi:hypothetical protein